MPRGKLYAPHQAGWWCRKMASMTQYGKYMYHTARQQEHYTREYSKGVRKGHHAKQEVLKECP